MGRIEKGENKTILLNRIEETIRQTNECLYNVVLEFNKLKIALYEMKNVIDNAFNNSINNEDNNI